MWVACGILSALFLGCYDIFRKKALLSNSALAVLWLSILCSTVIMIAMLMLSQCGVITSDNALLHVPTADIKTHIKLIIKAVIVLTSWIFGYHAMQHLPISLVSPMNATRPAWTLIGALVIFHEAINTWQWVGIMLTFGALAYIQYGDIKQHNQYLTIKNNIWLWCLVAAIITGALSGLYDKYLLGHINHNTVQVWYTIYQCILMTIIMLIYHTKTQHTITWQWGIAFISLFLILSDYVYFYALTIPGSLISVLSTTRRMGFIVPFIYGITILHEPINRHKLLATLAIAASMIILLLGS